MRFSTLDEWLTWQEGLHSAEIELGLARIREVAAKMGLLNPKATVISVAGTNGKGSCVTALEALLVAAGDSVGAFTSPHFHRYNERIRINASQVSDEQLCQSFQRIDDARGSTSLTYFEFGTLAALDLFQHAGVDYWLLEVGLGGRLDAVNIIDADIAIVTSIALDHEEWLGSDIEQIGREKAGIFRPRRWAICADATAPESVKEQADSLDSRYIGMGQQMSVTIDDAHSGFCWRGVDSRGETLTLESLPLPELPLGSVAAALQAYVLLNKTVDDQCARLLQHVTLTGRSQRICQQGIEFILDVAHNPAAASFQANKLRRSVNKGKTYCLAAIMADKDRELIFQMLLPVIDAWHPCGLPQVGRAASEQQLANDLTAVGASSVTHATVAEGLRWLLANAQEGDRVLVMGSFFTIAEALSFFNVTARQQR